MKYVLNIGVNRSEKGELFPGRFVMREDVFMCLRAAQFNVLHVEYRQHADRESTYVVVAEFDGTSAAVTAVCHALDQDCIAVAWYDDGRRFIGRLVGPRADEWGEFNPALFDLPVDYEV
jgi:hypothetical protein